MPYRRRYRRTYRRRRPFKRRRRTYRRRGMVSRYKRASRYYARALGRLQKRPELKFRIDKDELNTSGDYNSNGWKTNFDWLTIPPGQGVGGNDMIGRRIFVKDIQLYIHAEWQMDTSATAAPVALGEGRPIVVVYDAPTLTTANPRPSSDNMWSEPQLGLTFRHSSNTQLYRVKRKIVGPVLAGSPTPWATHHDVFTGTAAGTTSGLMAQQRNMWDKYVRIRVNRIFVLDEFNQFGAPYGIMLFRGNMRTQNILDFGFMRYRIKYKYTFTDA